MKDSLTRYRWVALGLALLSQSSASMVLQVLSPLVPLFQTELGLSKTEVGLLSSATSLGAWSVVLVAGLMTDRFGVRKMMSLGLIVTGALLAMMSGVTTLLHGIVIMFAAGVTRAAVFPSSTKAVLEWFPPRARATAMGVKQMGLPISGILTASLLPSLALAVGWRTAVAAPGVLIAVAGLATFIFYREAPGSGLVSAGRSGMSTTITAFLHNRKLLALCAMCFTFLMVQLASLTYLAVYLKEVLLVPGIPDEAGRIVAAGGFLAICQVGGASGRVGWGAVSDRLFHGRRIVVLAIIGVLSVAMSLIVGHLPAGVPLPFLALAVFLLGSTTVGWNGVYSATIGETVGQKYAATGIGLSMTLTEGGTISGPPLFGLLVDVTGSYQTAWTFLSCLSALGTCALLVAAREERRSTHQ